MLIIFPIKTLLKGGGVKVVPIEEYTENDRRITYDGINLIDTNAYPGYFNELVVNAQKLLS